MGSTSFTTIPNEHFVRSTAKRRAGVICRWRFYLSKTTKLAAQTQTFGSPGAGSRRRPQTDGVGQKKHCFEKQNARRSRPDVAELLCKSVKATRDRWALALSNYLRLCTTEREAVPPLRCCFHFVGLCFGIFNNSI